jgi:hypothetical protein
LASFRTIGPIKFVLMPVPLGAAPSAIALAVEGVEIGFVSRN